MTDYSGLLEQYREESALTFNDVVAVTKFINWLTEQSMRKESTSEQSIA